MARPKKEDSLNIKERAIVEATALLEKDLENLTLKNIAKQIGCSAPALYAHFTGKDDLLEHVRQHAFQNMLADKKKQYELNNHAPADSLRKGGHAFIEFAFKSPALYHLIFMAKPHLPTSSAEIKKALLLPLIQGLEAAQPAALKKGVRTEDMATTMWSALHGAIVDAINAQTAQAWQQAHQTVDTIMHLLFPDHTEQDI